MRENTVLLVAGVIAISIMACVAMYCGQIEIAAVGMGAMAGLIGGHMNGTQQAKNGT